MGNTKSFYNDPPKANSSSSSSSEKDTGKGKGKGKGQVILFQSSDEWRTHFEASKESEKLMVIDFFATWCGPCQMMEPIIREFAAKYTDVVFVKIDVDKLADVAGEFGIEAMPTFILMKKGKQVDKLRGAKKEELQNKIEKHRRAT